MAALHRLLDDWGLPQALIQLALVFLVFAAVEYASGDRVLPLGEVSVFLVLGEASTARLFAGGRWIRTIGPRSPVSSVGAACRSCLRGSGSGSTLLLLRFGPLHRAGLPHGLGGLRLAALRGGCRLLAVQLIY